ncbi:hypothetical protein Tco_0139181 [Tanacetum coccineum]
MEGFHSMVEHAWLSFSHSDSNAMVDELDRAVVDFCGRMISWVAWDNVLESKLNGGLGVSSFFTLNRALLLKWVWRFISGDGSLWCLNEVKSLKDSGLICLRIVRSGVGTGLEIVVANKMGAFFRSSASFRRDVAWGDESSRLKSSETLLMTCFSLRRMLKRDG